MGAAFFPSESFFPLPPIFRRQIAACPPGLGLNTTPSMSEAPFPVVATLKHVVDRGELAGAVKLIADQDRIMPAGSAGFADQTAHE
jgi:hypothetical protein